MRKALLALGVVFFGLFAVSGLFQLLKRVVILIAVLRGLGTGTVAYALGAVLGALFGEALALYPLTKCWKALRKPAPAPSVSEVFE